MPKRGTGSPGTLSKLCEDCGHTSHVACKICTSCGADFFATSVAEFDRTMDSSLSSAIDPSVDGERRRSERVKREKPDYYDVLQYETKRKAERAAASSSTPERRGRKAEKATGGGSSQTAAAAFGGHGGRPYRLAASRAAEALNTHDEDKRRRRNSSRATLTWKKEAGSRDRSGSGGRKRKRKSKKQQPEPEMVEEEEEEGAAISAAQPALTDYIPPPIRGFHGQVFLSEINRKLCTVMFQPG